MTVGRAGPLLAFTAAAWLLAGALALAAAALWPLVDEGGALPGNDAVAGASDSRAADPLPLASFARAWSLDLRRPLTDAPQQPGTAQAADAGAGVPVRLVGTILDPSRPRGIFLTPLGQTELKAAGEKVAGVEILRVEERSATLSVAGQPVTIRVEKIETILPAAPDPSQPPSARGNVAR